VPEEEFQRPEPTAAVASSSWLFLDDSHAWRSFGEADQEALEAKYAQNKEGREEVALGPLRWRYVVDFTKEEMQHAESGQSRRIKREVRAGLRQW